MQYLIENFELVKDIVIFILAVIAFIVTLFVRKNVSSALKDFKEVSDLKYKTFLTRNDFEQEGQMFSETKPDYILNPVTNELEELPIPVNIQEKIQSYVNCALDAALEKFLPKEQAIESDIIGDYSQRTADLAVLGEYMELAEDYREKLGLSDKASVADIYAAVDKSARELKKKIENKESLNEQKSKDEKGGEMGDVSSRL